MDPKTSAPPPAAADISAFRNGLVVADQIEPFLSWRNGVAYARMRVPLELVAFFDGKRELVQSLKTRDRAEATVAVRRIVREWQDRMRIARDRAPVKVPKVVAKRAYRKTLTADDRLYVLQSAEHAPLHLDDIFREWVAERGEQGTEHDRAVYLDAIARKLADDEGALLFHSRRAMVRALEDAGIHLDPVSGEFTELWRAFRPRYRSALEKVLERARGMLYALTPRAPVPPAVATPLGDAPQSSPAGTQSKDPAAKLADASKQDQRAGRKTLYTALDLWAADAVPPHAPSTVAHMLSTVEEFHEWHVSTKGGGAAAGGRRLLAKDSAPALDEIARDDIEGWVEHLRSPSSTPVKEEEGKGKVAAPPPAQSTVEKKLSAIKKLLRIAARKRVIESNVAQDVALPKVRRGKAGSRWKHFDDADLQRIFSSRIYLDGLRQAGGRGEAQFWLPIIALFTDMRAEEIACRILPDIKTSGGIAYFDVREDAEMQQAVKNDGSIREVPIPPRLIDLGFLAYVDRVKAAGHQRLFPELIAPTTGVHAGKFSKTWGQWWGRWLRGDLGITDDRKVF
ncbi:MAG: DUF6538 domain-containing protein, partial [Piscinibacter sp.]|uniref:DUF6538 domain-containing protein n=1 Tax=Piscinibacter sp. TaxID=1903157 RepID=UPI003D1500CE